uniref:RING-type domain-containing protein n=1 Tax=Meloidogyne incognita TaxID=6306 RepID=A0A914LKG2_MELIC
MSENVQERCSELPNSETRALFSCKICFEPYSKCLRCPISLNCGHTFCLVCIRKLGMNKSTIQCGICRKNTYANYKRLGKNIVLTELLEWMNILVNDIDLEPSLEEKLADEQQVENEWPGSQHFIGPANLELFYEEVQTFDALVHNWPTYGILQRRLDKRVQDLRCEMSAVEAQLRQAGDTYRDILVKLEELRSDLNNQMASYQLEEQDGHISPFRDGDNGWDFDDIGGWGGGGGGMASPPPVVLPMPVSDDSDRESANNQRERRRNNHGWNYNNNNRRPRRPQYHVLVLSDHPTSCQPLPERLPGDDWGSSSGWSDNEDDKENDNARA